MRKKRENVQNPAPYKQMREVLAMVVKAVPQLSASRASYFVGHQRQVAAQVRAIFDESNSPNPWYVISERPGVRTSQLIAEYRALFPIRLWQAGEEFDKDFPAPIETTTRKFRPNVEADQEHANKSYNDLQKDGIQGITLRERLIMELQYFKETGQHLDLQNITLCSGSLSHDGHVPGVYWYDGLLYVYWYSRDGAHGHLRSREVVL